MKNISQSYVPVSEGPIQGSIIVLTILTAVVHLFLGLHHGFTFSLLPTLFLLNGIGYLVLLVALYLPALATIQPAVRWVLIGYAALTIIVWIYITHAEFDPLDYIVKLAEIVLVILLCVEASLTRTPRRL